MGENSKIEWTDHTFNPWMGCTKVSEACKFCYAESFTGHYQLAKWGDNGTRNRTVPNNWKNPLKWNKAAYTNKTRAKVFCASLADIFEDHPSIEQAWRDELWALIKITTNLDWLLLTKRPENYKKFLPADWGDGYPNVWLGISVENQQRANERMPILAKTPAKLRFMSCEPLLGPIDFNTPELLDKETMLSVAYDFHWCIIGGESGPVNKVRKLVIGDVKKVIGEAEFYGMKIFFKQMGVVLAKYTNQQSQKGSVFEQFPNEFDFLKRREIPD